MKASIEPPSREDRWLFVSRFARWAGVVTVLGCVILVMWIDLPLTGWLHAINADRQAWMLKLLSIPVGLSTLMGVYLIVHILLYPWLDRYSATRRGFYLSIGLMVALAAKTMLKIAFGRTWPRLVIDPSPGASIAKCDAPSWGYLNDGIHMFMPFAGSSKAYAAFPSGSTALLLAFVVPFMMWFPKLRVPLGVLSGLVLATYVMSNTHFLSDVWAGAYIGMLCGMAAVAAEGSRSKRATFD
ncbi:phosphatase PAP2 family protein [Luteimonas sp. TWI1416]|uniref:phosphatase PAP2 family protein n=1 Tax=unclassified Luteimonas TaxID=2629088 RepID=UPI00320B76FD